jgi:cytochrome P450
MTTHEGAAARLAPAGPGEWVASRDADIRAVLSDPGFRVPEAGPPGPAGTVSWLRASVSRFANGPEHQRRRDLLVAELRQIDPGALRRAAHDLAAARIAGSGGPGTLVDVMSLLARRVPLAALAASLGIADAQQAAEAVISVAAGYFPGATTDQEQRADTATAWLAGEIGTAVPQDVTIARITLLVQGCEATASLIGSALHALQDAPAGSPAWTTDMVLAETLRCSPPAPAARRIAYDAVVAGDSRVRAGDTVLCDITAGNRDPAVFDEPDRFDPGRRAAQTLSFGHGIRPCPGPGQALALAAGVVDAVRERCTLRAGAPVPYAQSGVARIPQRLEVIVR